MRRLDPHRDILGDALSRRSCIEGEWRHQPHRLFARHGGARAERRRDFAIRGDGLTAAARGATVTGADTTAELLTARGETIVHLLGPSRREPHRLYDESEVRAGKLYLCGSFVA